MILVSSPSKPWAYSLKAIPRRQAVIDQYEPEIEAVYKQVEDVPTVKIHQVRDWIQEDSLKYVRGLVHDVMKHKIGDNEDLFQSGCDRSVLHLLRGCYTSLISQPQFTGDVDPYQNPTDFTRVGSRRDGIPGPQLRV